MKQVLIVDDEEQLLLTIQAGFQPYGNQFAVLTARNGKEAIEVLSTTRINLVVTDLKMPEMDGFELMAFLKNNFPEIPTIVMTAFATPQIESRLSTTGMIRMLEKPVDFEELTQLVTSLLENDLTGGTLTGISLPSFLQLLEMEGNSCLMEVKASDGQHGLLYFNNGQLFDAVFGKLVAEEAVYRILMLEDTKISFRSLPSKKIKRRIKTKLLNLIMEGTRLKDEQVSQQQNQNSDSTPESNAATSAAKEEETSQSLKGDQTMSDINAILEKFKVIDGFQAVGAFSPNGEMVAECNTGGINLTELGALANDVLLKAQKTTEVMKVGRGQLVHVEAPKAHVIARCLNESTDFAATASGRAHVHMVLIIGADGNVAMGKMKLTSAIQELAEFFR